LSPTVHRRCAEGVVRDVLCELFGESVLAHPSDSDARRGSYSPIPRRCVAGWRRAPDHIDDEPQRGPSVVGAAGVEAGSVSHL
jgi:hypothetical protein